jgi:hypothetical protein
MMMLEELQQANAVLVAENNALKIANAVLTNEKSAVVSVS